MLRLELGAGERHVETPYIHRHFDMMMPQTIADPAPLPEDFQDTVVLCFETSIRSMSEEYRAPESRLFLHLTSESGYDFQNTIWNAFAKRSRPLSKRFP